jgi:hypothetical protein
MLLKLFRDLLIVLLRKFPNLHEDIDEADVALLSKQL